MFLEWEGAGRGGTVLIHDFLQSYSGYACEVTFDFSSGGFPASRTHGDQGEISNPRWLYTVMLGAARCRCTLDHFAIGIVQLIRDYYRLAVATRCSIRIQTGG